MARPTTQSKFRLTPFHLWVAAAAALNLAGWVLSWFGQLNALGYTIFLAGLILGFALVWRKAVQSHPRPRRLFWPRTRGRFRRPLPLCFLSLAVLVFLGGLLHPPSNDDALSYRLPRILNWLAEGRWHWIHTSHNAMNSHVVGSEWLMAPWLALLRTDRWIFLINALGFLLLPGLIFSVFRGLGVRMRVAWHWMWLLPSGYNFVLQAGGAANDLIGTVYALAGLHFALRARKRQSVSEAWFAILAAALLSGCKLSNLPLLLPVSLALLPSVRLLAARPIPSAAVLLLAISASVVPIASLNLKYCGDWTGAANESIPAKPKPGADTSPADQHTDDASQAYIFVIKEPWVGLTGNAMILTCENMFPPVFPIAGWWNSNIRTYLPSFYQAKLKENFEPDFFTIRELPGEERAGLGFGICWLLVVGTIAAWRRKGSPALPARPRRNWLEWAILLSPFVSLAVFMSKSGITAAARIVAPYYALLLPALLQGRAMEAVVRTRWWFRAELVVYVIALGVLIVTPDRPLWPARTILNALAERLPEHRLIQRAARVYNVYAARNDVFRPVREQLPGDARTVGLFCIANEASTSLWRPFGSRRVRHVLASDTRLDLQNRGVEYIVARDTGPQFNSWIERIGGEILSTHTLTFYAARPPITWHIVRLRPAAAPVTQRKEPS